MKSRNISKLVGLPLSKQSNTTTLPSIKLKQIEIKRKLDFKRLQLSKLKIDKEDELRFKQILANKQRFSKVS